MLKSGKQVSQKIDLLFKFTKLNVLVIFVGIFNSKPSYFSP